MLCMLRAILLSDRSQLRVVTVSGVEGGAFGSAPRAYVLWLWVFNDLIVVLSAPAQDCRRGLGGAKSSR
jgi:hypothetical protein